MRTIYIDSENKCHVSGDGSMEGFETDFFDGKCDAFVEGFCRNTSNGYEQIYPWKPFEELENAQRVYERQLLADYAEALNVLGVTV